LQVTRPAEGAHEFLTHLAFNRAVFEVHAAELTQVQPLPAERYRGLQLLVFRPYATRVRGLKRMRLSSPRYNPCPHSVGPY
jgi:hypothetical protein